MTCIDILDSFDSLASWETSVSNMPITADGTLHFSWASPGAPGGDSFAGTILRFNFNEARLIEWRTVVAPPLDAANTQNTEFSCGTQIALPNIVQWLITPNVGSTAWDNTIFGISGSSNFSTVLYPAYCRMRKTSTTWLWEYGTDGASWTLGRSEAIVDTANTLGMFYFGVRAFTGGTGDAQYDNFLLRCSEPALENEASRRMGRAHS